MLHNDQLENINCLLDGTKELVMFDKVSGVLYFTHYKALSVGVNLH